MFPGLDFDAGLTNVIEAVEAVSPDAPSRLVYDRLRSRPDLVAIPVVAGTEPVGLIETEDGGWSAFYGPVALGIITHGGDRLRKPRQGACGLVDNEERCPQGPQAQQQQQQTG